MKIKLFTDDETKVELCKFYWELDHRGAFKYQIQDLADKFNLSKDKAQQIAKDFSYCYLEKHFCKYCKEPYPYRTREHYLCGRYSNWNCHSCSQENCNN